ncbi:hypothetical protein INT48_003787 [Thamnidium elegans]|uniref:Uncharacterized protein n=1 Tax=Thamnidium elegans TaxID=101142 RepID=A0A8H7W169_9FUNG|nr:hypothetical protein INT48_003787 [Thamnidium elegans]
MNNDRLERECSPYSKGNVHPTQSGKEHDVEEYDDVETDDIEIDVTEEEREKQPEGVWEYFKMMLGLGRDSQNYHKYSAIRNGVISCITPSFLKCINNIWKNNGTIRSTSEGFKADGIVRHKESEIMLVETCGVYGNVAMLKIQFDRHKGLYACLAMLCTIVVKFKYASLSTFNNIKIIFLHSKEFELKSQTISNCIKSAHVIKEHLRSTVDLINLLSTEHTMVINNDTLGISSLDEDKSPETIVRPQTHKIKDAKGIDTGLWKEDPVSCVE